MNYDVDYYDLLLRNNREYGEVIARIRWDFISQYDIKTVLDYGCGVPFFRAFRPNNIRCDTYDIGPYTQTGIDPYIDYDLVTFWDVLEHIPDLSIITPLLEKTTYIALSLPIKPQNIILETWKHYKPGEHIHYFTPDSLDDLLNNYRFKRVKIGTPECPPRQDIMDFVYVKKEKE